MTVIDHPRERAWDAAEARAIALMGTINGATASLVSAIRMLIDTDGWAGHGIQSVEHWVRWKAGVSQTRAAGLVRIARRIDELPACWGLFAAGRLTEDAMVRIACRVPAERDDDVASWAPNMLVSQLQRSLASLPELADPEEGKPPKMEPERFLRMAERSDGWGTGEFCLPPEEMVLVRTGLNAARDAEFRDRHDLEPNADLPESVGSRGVGWADALVRMASEACDSLDLPLQRGGYRGERNQIVLHHEVGADGRFGPGQLHLGPVVADSVARYLGCDAQVLVMAYRNGRLLGITPTDRTPSRKVRRYLEHRDQGCTHPLCSQRRWLQAHHLQHWEDGGPTEVWNLIMLCWQHHKALHHGDFTIAGNPEDGTLRFLDTQGRPIEPPGTGPPRLPRPADPRPFTPPLGERLDPRWFGWN